MKHFKFKALRQEDQWLSPAYVGVDSDGIIKYLSLEPPFEPAAIEDVNGFVLPGFQNAHCHAFQFAMAGLAEIHPGHINDDFWSWREAMYQCALAISPDQLEGIASMLYAEMLVKGITHVAEFHYLHHDYKGYPYANRAEMGERLLTAAKNAGIKITLIPVFYQRGNFGQDPHTRQRRFISKTIDDYFHLLADSAKSVSHYEQASFGFGVHSLRAVNPKDIVKVVKDGPANIPFHLHAAEQLKEVDDCNDYLKQRPVEWLLENIPLNDRFHLVHCTHMNDAEVSALAKTGANVVLCPSTEGNLGDGIFRLTDFIRNRGNFSIGTDSNISLNPTEDLRWLDYAQRLTTHKRNTVDNGGHTLFATALFSGRKAVGSMPSTNFFELDKPFDAIVFRGDAPMLSRAKLEHTLPSIVYASDSSINLGTIVNGKWVVKNQIHYDLEMIHREFTKAVK